MNRTVAIVSLIAALAVSVPLFHRYQVRLQEARDATEKEDQFHRDAVKKSVNNSVSRMMEGHYDQMILNSQKRLSIIEQEVREAKTSGEAALAVESLREEKAKLKELQLKRDEGVE